MGIVHNRLGEILAAKGHERAACRQDFDKQISDVDLDLRRGWIDAAQREDMVNILKAQWAEKYAVIEEKYAMTIDVLTLVMDDARVAGVEL